MARNPDHTRTPDPSAKTIVLLSLALIALIWCVFGCTLNHGFVNYDDGVYVTDNAIVRKGLTIPGLAWAMTHIHAGNWHPLTWMSHMVDCQIFGLNPAGHHFTSVLLHSIASVLLFLVLLQMTKTLALKPNDFPIWRCFFVAALFAIHPLRVESVAWVAERKDVLSAVFFMLMIAAYLHYAQRPSIPRYLAIVTAFVLGLMSKPMLVTAPVILLLLDYWPLGRFDTSVARAGRLFLEKIPLLILSAAISITTLVAQRSAILSDQQHPLGVRAANAVSSIGLYMLQLIWPVRLSPFYPYAGRRELLWMATLAAVVIFAVTVWVIVLRKRRPYLVTGWLWYLIMLLPVIGIIQVGMQGHADRYTYLPQIGLFLLIVWGLADLSVIWQPARRLLPALGCGAIVILAFCAWRQAGVWRDSKTLWTHTLAVSPANGVAEDSLGKVLFQEGAIKDATAHFENAVRLRPNSAEVHGDLGNVRFEQGRYDEAIAEFSGALALTQNRKDFKTAQLYFNLANTFRREKRVGAAIANYQQAIQIFPGYSQAHYNLGNQFRENGNLEDAITQYQECLRANPSYTDAHNNLALALTDKRRTAEAISHYEAALKINNGSLLAMNNLAWVLATSPDAKLRNGQRAVALAQRARQLAGDNDPVVLHTLAAAYAEDHQFPQAISTAEEARRLSSALNEPALFEALTAELALYQSDTPYHEAR